MKIFTQLLCLLALLTLACNKKSNEDSFDQARILERVEALGFSTDGVCFLPSGSVIVEGDILLTYKMLEQGFIHSPPEQESNETQERQNIVGSAEGYEVPDYSLVSSLTYSVDPSGFDQTWLDAIDVGFTKWMHASNQIIFNKVPFGTKADLTVHQGIPVVDGVPQSTSFGMSGFPEDGKIFSSITLNRDLTEDNCNAELPLCITNLTTHEIGHCIGFRHDNLQAYEFSLGLSVHLDGTPAVEGGTSIMSNGNLHENISSPSTYDYLASSFLFPKNGSALKITSTQIIQSGIVTQITVHYVQLGPGTLYNCQAKLYTEEGELVKGASGSSPILIEAKLEPGHYQIRLTGKNYKGDYTSPEAIKNIVVPSSGWGG